MNEYVKHAQDAIATDLPPIKEYQGGNIYQVTAFSNEKESQLIMNRLSNCKLTRWNPYGVDIISNTGGNQLVSKISFPTTISNRKKQWHLVMEKMISTC